MVKHKPKRWKGHCYLCAMDKKDKRQPLRYHVPWQVMKQMGKFRRIKRNYIPDDN